MGADRGSAAKEYNAPKRKIRGWAARGAARSVIGNGAALRDADVVMPCGSRKERMAERPAPVLREYRRGYGLTRERLRAAKPDVVVMHPGPMNRAWRSRPTWPVDPRSVITGPG